MSAAAAAIANAIKASGVIVRVSAEDFIKIVRKVEQPLVVCAEGGVFSTKYRYLTSYKGLAFYTKSSLPIQFASSVELIQAKTIWTP